MLGKDSKTEDGMNPHFVLVDEYHAHPDNSMLEVMESGMGSRPQALTYMRIAGVESMTTMLVAQPSRT